MCGSGSICWSSRAAQLVNACEVKAKLTEKGACGVPVFVPPAPIRALRDGHYTRLPVDLIPRAQPLQAALGEAALETR